MRNKKRMLAAGVMTAVLISTAAGCGNTSQNVVETQGIQGTTGVVGGTVQGSGNAENSATNEAGTASQNSSNTADNNAQADSSGAGTAQNGSNATDNTAQTGNSGNSGTSQARVSQNGAGTATMVNGGITEQEAKNIATGNAGITEDQIQYITVKQDWDDGRARYEVEFTAAGVEYDYELDATDGRILSADSEVIDKGYSASQDGAGTSQTAPGGISIETAKQTVMNRIPGIDAGNIYIHQDYDDGMYLYEGEAYYAEVKYEFEINAADGNIISWEAESIYD